MNIFANNSPNIRLLIPHITPTYTHNVAIVLWPQIPWHHFTHCIAMRPKMWELINTSQKWWAVSLSPFFYLSYLMHFIQPEFFLFTRKYKTTHNAFSWQATNYSRLIACCEDALTKSVDDAKTSTGMSIGPWQLSSPSATTLSPWSLPNAYKTSGIVLSTRPPQARSNHSHSTPTANHTRNGDPPFMAAAYSMHRPIYSEPSQPTVQDKYREARRPYMSRSQECLLPVSVTVQTLH